MPDQTINVGAHGSRIAAAIAEEVAKRVTESFADDVITLNHIVNVHIGGTVKIVTLTGAFAVDVRPGGPR